jgi:hypothetical protein
MNNSDIEITQIPNESVFHLSDGTPVINIARRERFINKLNKIREYHEGRDYYKVAHLLKEGWLMSSTYLVQLLGEDTLYEFLITYNVLMMDDYELKYLNKLEEDVIVYRGSNGTTDSKFSGMSWTWDIAIATVYAVNRQGDVLIGKVNKKDILYALFEEREYIIKPDTVTITDKMTWQEAVEKTGINVFQS